MSSNYSIQYSKDQPFKAAIKERFLLNHPGSKKQTFHLILDLAGSGISYQVGDSIGVMPINDPELVEKTIQAMHATGEEKIVEKQSQLLISLRDFFTRRANITEVSRKLIHEIHARQMDPVKKERLEMLLAEGGRERWKAYQEEHELWDALQENDEVRFTPEEISHLLMPLLPRFYSIASSQMEVEDEVHLTIALLNYCTNGHLRRGVCTHYLCELAPMHQNVVPVYIHPNHGFTLPENMASDLIMIGPGTGIAPFRAFMQERIKTNASGKNWLFFGEWTHDFDFFYQEFWQELVGQKKLCLHTAFSRDQEQKIYVQHRLMEQAADVYAWMQQGAYVYVCGDARRMAKDVEVMLCKIVEKEGKLSEAEAKAYIKKMRVDKQYLRDVY